MENNELEFEKLQAKDWVERFEITCSACKKMDSVPFKPRKGQKLYCLECYLKKRLSKAS